MDESPTLRNGPAFPWLLVLKGFVGFLCFNCGSTLKRPWPCTSHHTSACATSDTAPQCWAALADDLIGKKNNNFSFFFFKILNKHFFSSLCKCDYPKRLPGKARVSLYYAFCVWLLSVPVCIRFPAAMMQCFLQGFVGVLAYIDVLFFFVCFFPSSSFWLGDSGCKLCR